MPDGLHALASADGIRWTALREAPVIADGLLDSQNVAFWDAVRGEYREYHRNEFRSDRTGEEPYAAHASASSSVCRHATSSASGRRRWRICVPGLRPRDNWVYGDGFPSWGLVTTPSSLAGAPEELSIYTTEGYWRGDSMNLRRYSLRLDGFVAVQAPWSGGEIVTRPLVFAGDRLVLNFSASAAGSLRVEVLRDEMDVPVDGLALADCVEILGDDLERVVRWSGGPDLSRLSGVPVRLRLVLRDADLFSFRFADDESGDVGEVVE